MLGRLLIGLLAAAALCSAGALAIGAGPASIVAPIQDQGGIIYVTVRCHGAPNTTKCSGRVVLPQLDESPAPFTVAPGQRKRLRFFIPGPLHSKVAKLKTLTAVLTQVVGGQEQTTTASYRLAYSASGSGGGPGQNTGPTSDAPEISPGLPTHYEAVRDPRGDARSSFPLPQLFDIVLATAKRQSGTVILTVVSTAAITLHDSYGNPVAPCVEIPWASASQTPMFLFGNGQLAGYTQHNWPKMKTSIHGATISWTVPRTILARKGFTKGFLWRAAGGCDAHHLADLAPNTGFETFRWVKVA